MSEEKRPHRPPLWLSALGFLLLLLIVWYVQRNAPEPAAPPPEPAVSELPVAPLAQNTVEAEKGTDGIILLSNLPEYSGDAWVEINFNEPFFTESELTDVSYESYGELDSLGRCTVCEACIGTDLMPTEDRGRIGQVHPTGWTSTEYDFVDGRYLYNRCHLIGFQLTGENANKCNLITGTRYLNTVGMLPFENMTADYLKETGNHVLYRVTPIFSGDNLVADGVLMEGRSVEDAGDGIYFCVYCYNVQPGVEIDYASGESRALNAADEAEAEHFILNTGSKKFHRPECAGLADAKQENLQDYVGSRELLTEQGYVPCGRCKP